MSRIRAGPERRNQSAENEKIMQNERAETRPDTTMPDEYRGYNCGALVSALGPRPSDSKIQNFRF